MKRISKYVFSSEKFYAASAQIAKTSIVLRDTVVRGSTLVQITYMTRVIRERSGRRDAGPSEKKKRKNKKSTNASTSVYLVAYVDY